MLAKGRPGSGRHPALRLELVMHQHRLDFPPHRPGLARGVTGSLVRLEVHKVQSRGINRPGFQYWLGTRTDWQRQKTCRQMAL